MMGVTCTAYRPPFVTARRKYEADPFCRGGVDGLWVILACNVAVPGIAVRCLPVNGGQRRRFRCNEAMMGVTCTAYRPPFVTARRKYEVDPFFLVASSPGLKMGVSGLRAALDPYPGPLRTQQFP